ncbi:type IV pilin N-terminal domain-containing protein [Candidatus Pacearchaeota archaeon]|nr:type IV pilin N-terminal domain-containing protein [Candidatus Pacearchaeota archaeon]
MKKKGISSVISVVLIIFVTIILIGLLAAFVFPLVRDSIVFSGLASSMDITEAVYDSSISSPSLFISLKRNSEEVNLSGLKFVVAIQGNSVPYEIRSNLPGIGEERAYQLTDISSKPDYVEVYAIARKGNLEKILPLSDKQDVTVGQWGVGANAVDGELPPLFISLPSGSSPIA